LDERNRGRKNGRIDLPSGTKNSPAGPERKPPEIESKGEGIYFWEEEVTSPQEKRMITTARRAIQEPRPTLFGTMFSVISLTLHQPTGSAKPQTNGTDNNTYTYLT